MTWIASLHGDVSNLSAEAAAAAEEHVRDALQAIAEQLVPDGHVGVAATFHGTTTGDVNLLQPDAPTDPGPPVTGVPVISEPTEAPDPAQLAAGADLPADSGTPDAPPEESAADPPALETTA